MNQTKKENSVGKTPPPHSRVKKMAVMSKWETAVLSLTERRLAEHEIRARDGKTERIRQKDKKRWQPPGLPSSHLSLSVLPPCGLHKILLLHFTGHMFPKVQHLYWIANSNLKSNHRKSDSILLNAVYDKKMLVLPQIRMDWKIRWNFSN